MKKARRKRVRKPAVAKWSKEQADQYTKDLKGAAKIDGTFLHTVKSRKQEMKYTKKEVNDETS